MTTGASLRRPVAQSRCALVLGHTLPLLCVLSACSQGGKGEVGPAGPRGETGPAGTFSGSFSGDTRFDGNARFKGSVDFDGPVRVGGDDLQLALHRGTYPAVVSLSRSMGFSCGLPDALYLQLGGGDRFGPVVYSDRGIISLGGGLVMTTCNNVCYGPVTYFLDSPMPQTVKVDAYFDDKDGGVYLNGSLVKKADLRQVVSVDVPAGKIALSFVACSNNGPSVQFYVVNPFITEHSLTPDYERTFNRK